MFLPLVASRCQQNMYIYIMLQLTIQYLIMNRHRTDTIDTCILYIVKYLVMGLFQIIFTQILWILPLIFHSSSKLRKFRKFTYIMNPSYSRPVSLDPLFSQPVSLCVTCFTPVNWLVAVGRPFSSIWKLFGTMSMPCVVPEMLWSLDELKRALK